MQVGAKCKAWFDEGKEEFVVTVIEAIKEMVRRLTDVSPCRRAIT